MYILIMSDEEQGDEIAHADGDKGSDKAGKLEGVVDDVLAHMSGARTVKLQCGYLCGIVGQEEVAVDSWEHRHEEHG